MRNVLSKVPKASAEMVAAAIRTMSPSPIQSTSGPNSTRSPACWRISPAWQG